MAKSLLSHIQVFEPCSREREKEIRMFMMIGIRQDWRKEGQIEAR
jgi:hypothetical protein